MQESTYCMISFIYSIKTGKMHLTRLGAILAKQEGSEWKVT